MLNATDQQVKLQLTKAYLGDGVYAEFDGFQIWLYTSNGITNSDRIALDPTTAAAFHHYAKKHFGDK